MLLNRIGNRSRGTLQGRNRFNICYYRITYWLGKSLYQRGEKAMRKKAIDAVCDFMASSPEFTPCEEFSLEVDDNSEVLLVLGVYEDLEFDSGDYDTPPSYSGYITTHVKKALLVVYNALGEIISTEDITADIPEHTTIV